MRFEELLEKKEGKQLSLLKHLIELDGQTTIQNMSEALNIAKLSVETYLEDLTYMLKVYEGAIQLSYKKHQIELDMVPEFSLRTVEKDMYVSAIKYQVLDYIFHEPEFSTISLATSLSVSESTIFRKIKELNKLLKEFNLTIWQGKLVGEESQIRYFYFLFYWHTAKLYGYTGIKQDDTYIRMIEKGMNVSFSERSKDKVNIWLFVTKKRMGQIGQQHGGLRKKMMPYLKDPFYLQIKEISSRVFGQYAIELQDEEAMIHFAFSLSLSLFGNKEFHAYSIERSRFTPTAMLDTLVLETILLYYRPELIMGELEDYIYYHLSYCHPRLYFFKGDIVTYNLQRLWQMEHSLSSHTLQPLVAHLWTMTTERLGLDTTVSNGLFPLVQVSYLSILGMIDQATSRQITVGIHLEMDRLYRDIGSQLLITQIAQMSGAECEVYQSDKTYDLIITNTGISYAKEAVYVLSEIGMPFDLKRINEQIRRIYQKKYEGKLNINYL